MARAPRKMHLTQAHVAAMVRDIPDPGLPADLTLSTEADFADYVAEILAGSDGSGHVWIFAYGSLIWKPATDFVEIRKGLLRGWHRAFCLGWNTRHRGSDAAPGLMLALDRGGSCNGVLYRLPPDAIEESLLRLVKREMGVKPSAFPPRWVEVATERGPVKALTFCIDRRSGRYVAGLSEEQVATVLARAVGSRGSMVEYLFNTVRHLEAMGIADSHLWRLQRLVAERVELPLPPRPAK